VSAVRDGARSTLGSTLGSTLSSTLGSPGESLPPSADWRWVTRPVGTLALLIVAAITCVDLPSHPPAVIAAAAGVLVIAEFSAGWMLAVQPPAGAQTLIALTITGVGGALLALLPGAPGLVLTCLALIGLGLRLPSAWAIVATLVVLTALNLSLLLNAHRSPAQLAVENLSAILFLAVGAFVRSARIASERSRAAQARAEDLLEQLRASQAAQAEAAALAERARLAREIHDILAHALSGLVLTLDTMELLGRRHDGGTDDTMPKMLEQVARAQRIARDGLADTRRAIAALRGDEMPGPALLDSLVRQTAAATGIAAELTVTGEQRRLPPEIGLVLYRTAQEALINSAKYAGSNGRVAVRLRYRGDEVELLITDVRSADAGPPGPAGLTFGGYGLVGMRERAELLGGRLTAGPTDVGFRVLLCLPVAPEPGSVETGAAEAGPR
jgi:signal transduction histidine kinase